MSMTIEELMASPHAGLPERTYALCVAQKLVAETQALEERRHALRVSTAAAGGDAGSDEAPASSRPRRATDRPDPELGPLEERLKELYFEMEKHTGSLLLRGIEIGEWRRWVQANPPRMEEREGGEPTLSRVDDYATYGVCDADALLEDLGRFAAAWNGAALTPTQWQWLRSKASPGDLLEMCRWVVQMHESKGARAPLSPRPSSTTTPDETA
ncbi:hypothetical protein [Nocardioides ochotonae]|uniref:hypothetical protein n=1 Tax=Nocardioides ochotonae TaxID=2685869 RepID=UPI00140CC072|nr:hypothetical protein [Nocardioides ochotonae]